jgi:large subunit ribosomal protein L10
VDRAGKTELVTALHSVFKGAGAVVVAHYAGMTVAQMTDYRRRMAAEGVKVKVAKNRLAKLALKDTDSAGLSDLFRGATCIAYSNDPIAAARVAVKYSKDNDKLVILGGSMGKTILTANNVKALAELPSLDQLRAKLIGLLNAPATKIARTVAEPGAQLARVIQAKAAKAGCRQRRRAGPYRAGSRYDLKWTVVAPSAAEKMADGAVHRNEVRTRRK